MLCLMFSAGTQHWQDNSHYRGDFAGNYRHGQGRYNWPNGEVGYATAQQITSETNQLNSVCQMFLEFGSRMLPN